MAMCYRTEDQPVVDAFQAAIKKLHRVNATLCCNCAIEYLAAEFGEWSVAESVADEIGFDALLKYVIRVAPNFGKEVTVTPPVI